MLFSSITFLYYFLPIVIILYFLVPYKLKNLLLFLASIFFYFYGEPIYCLLMLISTLSGYLHGIWINKSTKYAKIPLVSSIMVAVGLLMYFKYTDFIIFNVNALFGTKVSFLRIALPIGISFYTFQILSYTIDVYRGVVKVQTNFIKFATYVTLFPQLIAGPIVTYSTVEKELTNRRHTFEKFAYGVNRFVIGLAKKVLLANTLGEIGQLFINSENKTVLFYWMAAIAFMLHIYFDFSGYSDMAIGLGRMFGFHFLENFNYPYISKSITEFWRRWHISLGSWFREYIYIPMGGNRVQKIKWIRNILIVWFLTGFWHGAEWNFIIWGLMFALLLILEKMFLKEFLNKCPAFFSHGYVLFVVLISFVIFNANGIKEGIDNLKGMFGLIKVPFTNFETNYYLRSYALVYIIGFFGVTPIVSNFFNELKQYETSRKLINVVEPLLLILLLVTITAYLVDGSFNPFLYFRF